MTNYPPTAVPLPSPRKLAKAATRAAKLEDFARLKGDGMSLVGAARAVDLSPSHVSGANSQDARYRRGGVAALEPRIRRDYAGCALTRRIESLEWFIPAANFFYLSTRQRRRAYALAVSRAANLPSLPAGWTARTRKDFHAWLWLDEIPTCPADVRRALRQRERRGRPFLPPRIERQIRANPARRASYSFDLPISQVLGPALQAVAHRIATLRPEAVCRLTLEVL